MDHEVTAMKLKSQHTKERRALKEKYPVFMLGIFKKHFFDC